ncbi:TetR/AcrR family transcriptional regulator [Georgenia ruanii]|nr:TetR/AcrR family transcriptional regulator [Georgenia ruanii]MPV88103.1 TetR family transcriptional regulator [Georgenia ruanii]
MPRVTAEHRATRREQILQAAFRCVARSGFQGMTMADVIGESGLSAGAVYGYFRGKRELLLAIADRAIGSIDEVFHGLLGDGAAPHPADVLRAALEALMAVGDDDVDLTVVTVQAWAEAVRGGEVRELLRPRVARLREQWAEVMRRHQAAGHLAADADPEEAAQAMVGLVPGFILQRLMLGDLTVESFTRGVRQLLDAPRREAVPTPPGA